MARSKFPTPAPVGFRRDKLCRDLLLDIGRDEPDLIPQSVAQEFLVSGFLAGSIVGKDRNPDDADSKATDWTGVISEEDILRFALQSPRSELGTKAQERLSEELDKIILDIAELFHAEVGMASYWVNLGEDEQRGLAWSLPQSIKLHRASTESARSAVTASYLRIEALMPLISETHARLQADLAQAVAKYPREINSRSNASAELLAARIEAALIKLSLIRARATRALYNHRAPDSPEGATLAQALEAAHRKLKVDERKMREEEAALDRQLAEYEGMLRLVDGAGGGFAQVVEDWTRVQKERDECVRDLRRLGWTGD
ncbi:hypothetical protein H0H81_000684 [Sphagnurus paluster]|uniref:Uncharacterized protein n=1 Tax=Sphagnurus paluster TaxID=117069 RepID=A0A9P7GUX5_9AGAR|nr:hypothetical protein H0H81_000684 [Sphagnurus paluster]